MALFDLFRPRRSAAPQDLARFLQAQAAYVAQKTVLGYCRVKSGRNEKRYFTDADFLAALQHCRWQVYFAALGDVTAVLEAHLRPHVAGDLAFLADGMLRMHAAALLAEPPPPEEQAGSDAARDGMPGHLAELQMAPPQPADRIRLLAEPVLFATLPIHAEQRKGESLAIRGALRFQIVTTQQELERRFDAAPLASRLITEGMGSAA